MTAITKPKIAMFPLLHGRIRDLCRIVILASPTCRHTIQESRVETGDNRRVACLTLGSASATNPQHPASFGAIYSQLKFAAHELPAGNRVRTLLGRWHTWNAWESGMCCCPHTFPAVSSSEPYGICFVGKLTAHSHSEFLRFRASSRHTHSHERMPSASACVCVSGGACNGQRCAEMC